MSRIELIRGDITTLRTEAIVNAAKTSLLGGGGVDGAIHKAAGPALLEECRTLNGCNTGEAKITQGYKLPARYVIHTVGPVWQGGMNHEPDLLRSCYLNSLQLADSKGIKSIAFPNISTGIYGYPKKEAALLAIDTVKKWISGHTIPEKIVFAVFDEENYQLYLELLNEA